MDQHTFNTAAASFKAGNIKLATKVKITNPGVLAIGGLVSSILLSTTVLVWVLTSATRRHPVPTGLCRGC
ncbi:MAG: hypothetical protein ACK4MH_02740 [Brevundimonas sp.]|uniref:hypothetical protein n=1 Tax=Brevundimonas sp. TaxID=1871086 RepID=UPI003919D935